MWLVPGVAVAGLLAVGSVLFFGLLVALNGVSEATATRILVSFLVLLGATLIFTPWASRRTMQKLTLRTNWSHWVCAPLVAIPAVLVATAVLIFGALFSMLLFGVR
jgi:hypothetical protein